MASIANVMTIDTEKDKSLRRILVTLPAGVTKDTLQQIIDALEKKDYSVAEVRRFAKQLGYEAERQKTKKSSQCELFLLRSLSPAKFIRLS